MKKLFSVLVVAHLISLTAISGSKIKKYFAAVFLILCLVMPMAASAELFTFSYDSVTPSLVDVDGIITAAPTGNPNEWWITGVTGTRNGNAITSFVSGGPGFFNYADANIDNLMYVPPGELSHTGNSGFVFGTADGEFNPYWLSGTTYYEYKLGGGNGGQGIEIVGSISAVPEPATMLLLGFGLIGLAGFSSRRKN
jgi:hypothetical protein